MSSEITQLIAELKELAYYEGSPRVCEATEKAARALELLAAEPTEDMVDSAMYKMDIDAPILVEYGLKEAHTARIAEVERELKVN